MGDDDKLSRFKAGGEWHLDLPLDAPLHERWGLRGNVQSPGPGTLSMSSDGFNLVEGTTSTYRLKGSLPITAPGGTYRLSLLMSTAPPGSPFDWIDQQIAVEAGSDDFCFIVEEAPKSPPPPRAPKLLDPDK
jgi:hypothetical protein